MLQTGGKDKEKVVHTQTIAENLEMEVTQVGAYWITSKPRGSGVGNLSLPAQEKKAKKEEKDEKKKEASGDKKEEIKDPAVQAQYDSMKESLGMKSGDAEKPPANVEGQNPQDTEMVVDAVADAEPVAEAVPTVQELYPDCAFADDLLYRVTLSNKLETNVKVEVSFSLVDDKAPVNLSYPCTALTDYLKPAQTATVCTLQKANILGEPVNFANLKIEVTHTTYKDNDFQMNSFASQSDIPSQKAKAQQGASTSAVPSGIKD